MIVSLKTENRALLKMFEVPVIGPFIIFLIAMLPIPLMFILNGLFDFASTDYIERINALVAGAWNLVLLFGCRVKICFIFIPCWILFTLIGILRYLQLIGG